MVNNISEERLWHHSFYTAGMQPRENVGGHEGFAEQRVQLHIYKSSFKLCPKRVNWPNYTGLCC